MLWQGSKIFVFPKNLANTHISTIQAFAPSSVPTYQRSFTTSAGSADLAGCNVHNDNQSSHDHKDHSGQNNDEDESFSSTNSPPILVIAEKGTIILPSGYFIIVIIILIIIIMNLIINITRPIHHPLQPRPEVQRPTFHGPGSPGNGHNAQRLLYSIETFTITPNKITTAVIVITII